MTGRAAHETLRSWVGRRRAANGGGSPLVQRRMGPGRGLRVRRAALSRTNRLNSTRCVGVRAAQGDRSGSAFECDNCLYQLQSCQSLFACPGMRTSRDPAVSAMRVP